MDVNRGILIAIEGADGSGKSTQFTLLLKHLQADGREVTTLKFPRYDEPSSYFVREYLGGSYGKADEVGPYTASIFYALDRYAAAHKINEALDAGKIVLLDRYVGSNMAHQGTKFTNAEERRGYFIWLDNLEFEMLKSPRPDLNIVLHVPLKFAQQLLDKTEKERDIHEADAAHLERSIQVYEDLSQLFPKDFARIDCVRDDKLMPVELVHELIWQKIVPLLPVRPEPAAPEAPAPAVPAPQTDPSQQHVFAIEGASDLLIRKIGSSTAAAQGSYEYITPAQLTGDARDQFQTNMNNLLALHGQLTDKLMRHLARTSSVPAAQQDATFAEIVRKQVFNTLRAVLPVAIKSTAKITAFDKPFEDLLSRLLGDTLPEARQAGKQLLAEARKVQASFMPGVTEAGQSGIQDLAQEYLGGNHAVPTDPVQLAAVTPRNELDLLPDILFEHTARPLKELQRDIAAWPYTKKAEVFLAYLQQPNPSALQHIRYDWDILCDYNTLRELQAAQPDVEIRWQALTPRYGYAMPDVIDDAGLSDDYDQCFDTSLALYSTLQEAGYPLEAQYATLQGHKLRCKLSLTAEQMLKFINLQGAQASAPYLRIVEAIVEKARQTHPLYIAASAAVR